MREIGNLVAVPFLVAHGNVLGFMLGNRVDDLGLVHWHLLDLVDILSSISIAVQKRLCFGRGCVAEDCQSQHKENAGEEEKEGACVRHCGGSS